MTRDAEILLRLSFLAVFIWVVFGIPLFMLLRRFGYNGWWAALAPIPMVPAVILWVLAFSSRRVMDMK